jgi:3-deoxy-7-phosphoheptulonate synthase
MNQPTTDRGDDRIEDRNLEELTPLVAPKDVKARVPLDERAAAVVRRTRAEIRAMLRGKDRRRLLAVVGPCSIHDPAAALDYATRLQRVAERTRDSLLVVMRTYFEKPRTTVGWKGLINDPRLDGSCDIAAGLLLGRSVLLDVNRMGLPCAGEILDPLMPQYIGDLLSWAAIGARTTESQTHREMASGLSMPVGFKNGTDGGLEVAVNAMISASHRHSFVGITADGATAVIKTLGNPDRHLVLRGGKGGPNYRCSDVSRAVKAVAGERLARPVMIDCSHDNSGKDHTRQAAVCRDVVSQFCGDDLHGEATPAILGFMLESNVRPGKQAWARERDLLYGVSITDACIGWDETERLLLEAADAVAGAVAGATSSSLPRVASA